MAGSDSSLLDDSYQNLSLTGFSFAFNFESEHPDIPNNINFSTGTTSEVLLGEVEFLGKKRIRHWRYLIPMLIFFGVLGTYFIMNEDNEIAAKLYAFEAPTENITVITTIPTNTDAEMSIAAIEIPEEKILEAIKVDPTLIEKEVIEKGTQKPTKPLASVPSPKPKKEIIPNIPEVKKAPVFHTENLAKARTLASNTGRYIFMKFGADWCVTCKLMETTALKNESVVRLLKEKFVVLDIDIEKTSGKRIQEEYYVQQLPTIIIVDELGNQIKRKEGAMGTISLKEMLESVSEYIYLEEEILTTQIDNMERAGE